MRCPDCNAELVEIVEAGYGSDRNVPEGTYIPEPYYKCPKCKEEFDPEDLEESQ